jgi:catechol 2,3-dioxygenase-like lactoylglutathione lyase family enzyme
LYTYGWPGVKVAFIGRGNLKIELFQNEQASPMDGERQAAQTNLRLGGINHFAIQFEDLDEAVSTLHAKGVEIVSPPKDVPNGGGDRFAFIHDNEHMLVELFQPA